MAMSDDFFFESHGPGASRPATALRWSAMRGTARRRSRGSARVWRWSARMCSRASSRLPMAIIASRSLATRRCCRRTSREPATPARWSQRLRADDRHRDPPAVAVDARDDPMATSCAAGRAVYPPRGRPRPSHQGLPQWRRSKAIKLPHSPCTSVESG
jgi:hypothetical protein